MSRRNTKKKLLIMSYPFPPIPYSGTYRILRMCKGLVKLGIEVHVVTINIDPRIPNDYALLSKVPLSVKIHRTRIIDPWLSYQSWSKNRKNSNSRNFANKLMSLLMRLITIPDHQIFWIPFAVRKSLNVMKQYKIKNVLITSPPVSSLLTGTLLKKLANINVIADLRDPIVGNVAQVNLLNPRDIISKFEKRVLRLIEQRVIDGADVIIANTETHRQELSEKYQRANIRCIRNCFDEDDYKEVTSEKYKKFTIAHIGSMYGLRKPDILFKAIKKLEQELFPQELCLQVLFVGSIDPALEKVVSKYQVQKYVKFRGMIPHRKAIEVMVRSHLLLLIKASGKDGLGQIPAKFFEYLGTRNKILYIGPKVSEVAEIIRQVDCGWIVGDDAQLAFSILLREYQKYSTDREPGAYPLTRYKNSQFNSSSMAMNLSLIINSL